MVVLSDNGVITKHGLPIIHSITSDNSSDHEQVFREVIPFKEYKKQTEKSYLKWVLQYFNNNVAKASKELEITSRQLFNKINEYGLRK